MTTIEITYTISEDSVGGETPEEAHRIALAYEHLLLGELVRTFPAADVEVEIEPTATRAIVVSV